MPKTKTGRKPKYRSVLQLPPLPPDQFEALRQNIGINGVLVPILVDGDGPVRGIIDGNYRKKIADELGYECPEIVQAGMDDNEKRTLARALNLARRQLSRDEKRRLIADQLRESPDKSLRWIAKMLGVHHTTVGSVRHELFSTGGISQLDRTVGTDGKSRPARYGFRGGRYNDEPRPNVVYTPVGVCEFLYDLISPQHQARIILDPCSGAGALTRPWKGRKVVSFESGHGLDFFACKGPIPCDLVLCNPPFNNENGDGNGRVFLPERFLRHILKVVPRRTPIALIAPMGMRLNQRRSSGRWRWLRDECPSISSIVSLPLDIFPNVQFHTEILLFRMKTLESHYFLPDEYVA